MMAKIKFKKPKGVNEEDLANFIISAVSSWGGGFHPDDPLFDSLDPYEITVNGKLFFCEKK